MADAPALDTQQQALAALVRLVVNYRLLTVLVSTVYLGVVDSRPMLTWAFVGVGLANLLPLLRWERLAPQLLRHPAYLAVDLIVTIVILMVTGINGPLLSYTFGTAFVAGVLYAWTGAGVFSSLLVGAYAALLVAQPSVRSVSQDFQAIIGTPALYVLLAVGGAAVRDQLIRQSRMESLLRAAREQAAHGEERARLARELHDTVGKSLHGIGLLARALPNWVRRDPQRAIRDARALAAAAESTAAEARELLAGMRADRIDQPLDDVVRHTVEAWSEQCEPAPKVRLELQPMPGLTPDERIELLGVLREALRNVQRHAQAQRVWVSLGGTDHAVTLRVRDDGRGIDGTVEPQRLAARGHFGLLGMRERMERVGGTLTIAAHEPSGVVVTAELAKTAAQPSPSPLLIPRLVGR